MLVKLKQKEVFQGKKKKKQLPTTIPTPKRFEILSEKKSRFVLLKMEWSFCKESFFYKKNNFNSNTQKVKEKWRLL